MPIEPRRSRSLPRIPSRQPGRQRCEQPLDRVGDGGQAPQRHRLPVDGVAAEQLVGPLAGQHHLDVLARLAGDEVQRHQRRVGHRVVEVPHDQRQGVHHLLGADHLGDVLDPDRGGRLGGHVDLGEALALEAGGEGEQLRVVLAGQRCDRGGVDAAGQERADREVRAQVLGHRVLAARRRSRGRACSGSVTGRIGKSGWKYRLVSTSPPGRSVKLVPESIRVIRRCIDAGSGTYCSVR